MFEEPQRGRMETIDVQRLLSLQQRKTEQSGTKLRSRYPRQDCSLVEEKLRAVARGGQSAP